MDKIGELRFAEAGVSAEAEARLERDVLTVHFRASREQGLPEKIGIITNGSVVGFFPIEDGRLAKIPMRQIVAAALRSSHPTPLPDEMTVHIVVAWEDGLAVHASRPVNSENWPFGKA